MFWRQTSVFGSKIVFRGHSCAKSLLFVVFFPFVMVFWSICPHWWGGTTGDYRGNYRGLPGTTGETALNRWNPKFRSKMHFLRKKKKTPFSQKMREKCQNVLKSVFFNLFHRFSPKMHKTAHLGVLWLKKTQNTLEISLLASIYTKITGNL